MRLIEIEPFEIKKIATIKLTNYGNTLPISIIRTWEDYPGSSLIPDLLNVYTLATNQEFVVLGLGFHFGRMARQLFLVAQFLRVLMKIKS